MSVTVYANQREDEFEGVRYKPGYTFLYGSNDKHGIELPATVAVDFNNGSLRLEIADAHALMEGLAVALVEHAVALKDSATDSKAVA